MAAPAHAPGGTTLGLPHASPSVRKFARELGVPLAEIKGSGLKGRITAEDIQSFTKSVMAGAVQTVAQAAKAPASSGGGGSELGLIPWPKVDFAKFGPIERKEMGRIKKISGANLLRNAIMIPAVTNHDDADITDLEAFRVSTNKENEKSGVKVTMLAFLIKASVAALKKFPEFNSSLDGDSLVYPLRPSTVEVLGAVAQPCRLPYRAMQEARDYLRSCQPSAEAEQDYLWLIQPDGQTRRIGVAMWNLEEGHWPVPGSRILVPIKNDDLEPPTPELNQQLAEFLATQPVAEVAP